MMSFVTRILANPSTRTGLGAVGLSLALSACAAIEPGRSLGRQIDDFNAVTSLKSSMLRAEGYVLGGVDVELTEGVALLSGSTPREEDRLYAECLAWSAQGVRSVTNQISVGQGRGFNQASRDAWLTQQVRARLASDRTIRSVNYNIETHQGVVYLLGYARSAEERDRAAAHVSLIEGVERVVVLARAPEDELDLPDRGRRRAEACAQSLNSVPTGQTETSQ